MPPLKLLCSLEWQHGMSITESVQEALGATHQSLAVSRHEYLVATEISELQTMPIHASA